MTRLYVRIIIGHYRNILSWYEVTHNAGSFTSGSLRSGWDWHPYHCTKCSKVQWTDYNICCCFMVVSCHRILRVKFDGWAMRQQRSSHVLGRVIKCNGFTCVQRQGAGRHGYRDH